MKTVIKNATILPMTGEDDILRGDIGIEDDTIRYVGNVPAGWKADKEIDATAHAVLPSFVNAHTHTSMVLMRNYKDSESCLETWLSQVWAIEAKLNGDDIEKASRLAMAEMIRSGITAFADMYFFQDRTARCANEAGMRADIGLTILGPAGSARQQVQQMLPQIQKHASDLVKVSMAPHSVYTVDEKDLVYVRDAARDMDMKVHIHMSETRTEVENCLRSHNMTPAMYLDSLGMFRNRTILPHCVHITDEEVSMLRQYDVTLVHCPSSNSKLASGIARVRDYRKAGLCMAFGTDGASSNNNLNIMKEINLGCMIASVSTGDTQALKPYDAIRMATTGGARALGIDSITGTLEAGKKADLIMVDLGSIQNTPTNNIWSALVYSASSEDIDHVFCNGRMLLENRRLTTIDEAETRKATIQAWNDLCRN